MNLKEKKLFDYLMKFDRLGLIWHRKFWDRAEDKMGIGQLTGSEKKENQQ